MLFKRHFCEVENDESEVPSHEFRKRPTSAATVSDVMNGLSVHEFALKLEPFFQRVVREEVERALHSSLRLSLNQVIPESSGVRTLRLHFVCKLPSTLFTNTRIESEDSEEVKVVLLDVTSNNIVTFGPLSSARIEMLVLDGDFLADDKEDWSEKEFHAKIVHEREGKRPLLTGNLVVALRNGIGYIGDISFTDNSSWIRSRRFRLGARMQNTSSEIKIREAISEAFMVKDHRGESYKKHHPPYLGDDVWRLERIAKDGACHTRLASCGISTVKDFLCLYYTDPSLLRNILGGGISNKTWDTIVEHAKSCVIDDDKCYIYYRAAERVGLLLNSVFKVVGVTFNGQNYQSPDCLSTYQMLLVEELKQHAYQNSNDLVAVDDPAFIGHQVLLSTAQSDTLNNPCLGLQNISFPVQDDRFEMQMCNHLASFPQYSSEVIGSSHLESSGTQNAHGIQLLAPTLRNSFVTRGSCYGTYGGENDWTPCCSAGPVILTGDLAFNDNFQAEASTWKGNELFKGQNNHVLDISSSNFGLLVSKKGTPRARWRKIQTAIKWWISVRRTVASKKMNRFI